MCPVARSQETHFTLDNSLLISANLFGKTCIAQAQRESDHLAALLVTVHNQEQLSDFFHGTHKEVHSLLLGPTETYLKKKQKLERAL